MLKLIIRQGMLFTVIGVIIGLAGGAGVTGVMSSLLFGVSATDQLTFAVIAFLLITVALLAGWIPARRTTKVDPMIALLTNNLRQSHDKTHKEEHSSPAYHRAFPLCGA